jgi:cysteinyl-tRNA synthetase
MHARTPLHLTDTLAGEKRPFVSNEPGRARLYTCGPSVYRRQHLGNYRTYLYEDALHKLLEYLGYHVERMVNFTDVEDKLVGECREQGKTLGEVVGPVEETYFRECAALGIDLPPLIPRSSTSVEAAVAIIRSLVDKGHAYEHEGDYYFRPTSYEGFGRIYGLDMSTWPKETVRFDRDTYPGQQWNLGDFILWHAYVEEDGDIAWETELGKGRPSWNVQDPSMIVQHMGLQVDISCGGEDNLYRHHDYNLAIMESYSGLRPFAGYWLHGNYLLMEGEKMSKSKGNVQYLEDLLEAGREPRLGRMALLWEHYRDQLDLRRGLLDDLAARLAHARNQVVEATRSAAPDEPPLERDFPALLREAFEQGMCDDLDFRAAFEGVTGVLDDVAGVSRAKGIAAEDRLRIRAALADVDGVFGLLGR